MLGARTLFVLLVSFPLLAISPALKANHKWTHDTAASDEHSQSDNVASKSKKYERKVKQAFRDYKRKTAKVWGDYTVMPASDVSVTYRNNLKERSVVDFTNGTVKVELAVQSHKAKHSKEVKVKLAHAVSNTIRLGVDARSIVEIAQHPDAPELATESVLDGLVANEDGEPLKKKDINEFLFTATRKYKLRSLIGSEGKKFVAISTEFSLIEQHLIVRSKLYEDMVDKNAKLHNIPSPLIFAIMETESAFNPMAKSPVPAFGLMQLVPTKGARDAFRFLYDKDKVVKDTYLYKPKNNIDLGVAYLHMLIFHYLKFIQDPESRKWAAVAAYNTGVSNVLQSFAGKFKRSSHSSRYVWRQRALNKINNMTQEEVFEHLKHFLPHQETREYIVKVRERMRKYEI